MSELKKTTLYGWYAERRYGLARRANQRRIPFVESVLPKQGIGAELGVFRGDFSPVLLKHTQATKLHLIDAWYFNGPRWHWANGNTSTVDAVIRILQALKKEIESGRILVHVGDDRHVLTTFPDDYFDWVYVDSSHDYDHTVDELRILIAKVKDGGVIAGDDWQPDPAHPHHGVYRAVMDLVGSGMGYRLVYSGRTDSQWAVRKY